MGNTALRRKQKQKSAALKRRMLLCSVLFLTVFFALQAHAADLGDITGDGVLSAADARLALRFAVELQPPTQEQRLSADADHDGVLSAADARLILRVVVELEAFTHPFDRADHTVLTVKAPTCAEEGILHTVCVCGAVRAEAIPKTDAHVYPAEWTPKTPAGCETRGVNEKTCALCNNTITETVPPLGHAFEARETKAACETEGLLQTVCSRCGKIAASKTLPPTGHTLTETVAAAATCTLPGEKTVRCENCDFTASAVLPALGHDFSEDYTEDRAATCTEPGLRSRKCSRCSAVAGSEPIPALGHDFAVAVTAPTCTQAGLESAICTRCGAVGETKALPAAGHDYRVATETLADCTLGGVKLLKCAVCGATAQETIPAAQHRFEAVADGAVEAACLTAGTRTLRCTVCGKTQTEELPALGHQKTRAAQLDAAPTCVLPGKEGWVCAVCGADLSVEIVPTGHSPRVIAGVPPTCTANGSSDETVCSVCGAVLTASVPLQATGHSFSAWETDAETGVLTRRCTVCGEVQTRTPLCAHRYTETSKTPPGCETTGELIETCSLCGDEKRTLLPPTGHDYQAQTVLPTCTAAGYTLYTCANCGQSYTDDETLPSGHAGETRGQRSATCSQSGYSGDVVCSRCGAVLQKGETIPLLPHTPANAYVTQKAASCTGSGSETLACAVCGAVLETKAIAALGHDISYQYENNGAVRHSVCARCGAVLETRDLTAALYTADGTRTDIFDLENALSAAQAGSTVVLLGDYMLRASAAVPAGVCFVVPCFEGDKGYTAGGGIPDGTAAANGDTKSRFCTLTIPENCTLTVEGTLLVSAQTGRRVLGPGADQDVAGGWGEIVLHGQITVKNGGCFDCAGFVNASVPAAKGKVTLFSGASMYETAEILRFRGTTSALTYASLGVYPIYEQSVRAMRAELTVHNGAAVYGRTKLFAAAANEEASLHPAVFPLIGENGLFRLANGATVTRTAAREANGEIRCSYRFCGGAEIKSAAFTPLPGATLQTGDFLYPLNGDASFTFEEGDYTLCCNLLLLPGATFTVGNNAAFSVPAGRKLVLANNGFYEKDALVGGCAYPAGRAPAVLEIAENGAVFAEGTLAGQVTAQGTLIADNAVRTATVVVPTALRAENAKKTDYEVEIS